jgi:hypothetical protein
LLLASLPPGFPRNPNVLLIRTHPNPFPSVGYNTYSASKKMHGNKKVCSFSNILKYLAQTHMYTVSCFSSSKDRSAHVFQCKKQK